MSRVYLCFRRIAMWRIPLCWTGSTGYRQTGIIFYRFAFPTFLRSLNVASPCVCFESTSSFQCRLVHFLANTGIVVLMWECREATPSPQLCQETVRYIFIPPLNEQRGANNLKSSWKKAEKVILHDFSKVMLQNGTSPSAEACRRSKGWRSKPNATFEKSARLVVQRNQCSSQNQDGRRRCRHMLTVRKMMLLILLAHSLFLY